MDRLASLKGSEFSTRAAHTTHVTFETTDRTRKRVYPLLLDDPEPRGKVDFHATNFPCVFFFFLFWGALLVEKGITSLFPERNGEGHTPPPLLLHGKAVLAVPWTLVYFFTSPPKINPMKKIINAGDSESNFCPLHSIEND